MGNGLNEPVEFTRGDAERLQAIEVKQNTAYAKLDTLADKFDYFITTHTQQHVEIERRVDHNSRFRRNTVSVLLWVFSSGVALALLATGVKAMGWLD